MGKIIAGVVVLGAAVVAAFLFWPGGAEEPAGPQLTEADLAAAVAAFEERNGGQAKQDIDEIASIESATVRSDHLYLSIYSSPPDDQTTLEAEVERATAFFCSDEIFGPFLASGGEIEVVINKFTSGLETLGRPRFTSESCA